MTLPLRHLVIAALFLVPATAAAQEDLPTAARSALKRATDFFLNEVSSHGGYVYRYSADLKKREGEGKAGVDTVWIQPPGTPSVGMAYLDVYQLTDDRYYLKAARSTGECLLRGQLYSGGWDHKIEFGAARPQYAYRVDSESNRRRNTTTFDDDKTQSALRFLIRLDDAYAFQDDPLHEATMYALEAVIKAQYPNGAWPQRYREFPDPGQFPVKKASYPESWSRTFPSTGYGGFYTFNDNAIADIIDAMFLAADVYQDERYRRAAEKAGGFILLAQLPDPQPAWAQQYDADMHPAWARKFEPPAVTGGESQGVMSILLRLYRETGKRKYLEPIPRAIEYLRRSQLQSGRLARFYELQTNKPLYFTKRYELTYDDGDVPTHYGFKVDSKLDRIEAEYRRLEKLKPIELAELRRRKRLRPTASAAKQAQNLIAALDERGAWVEDGRLRYHGEDDETTRIIDSRTFARNIVALARYAGATSK